MTNLGQWTDTDADLALNPACQPERSRSRKLASLTYYFSAYASRPCSRSPGRCRTSCSSVPCGRRRCSAGRCERRAGRSGSRAARWRRRSASPWTAGRPGVAAVGLQVPVDAVDAFDDDLVASRARRAAPGRWSRSFDVPASSPVITSTMSSLRMCMVFRFSLLAAKRAAKRSNHLGGQADDLHEPLSRSSRATAPKMRVPRGCRLPC